MLENILNIYYYPQKSTLTNIADAILWPTNRVFNYHRISIYSGHVGVSTGSTNKCVDIFFRILMGIVSIVLLPISFVAVMIKLCDYTNAKVHKSFKEILVDSPKDDENCICYDETNPDLMVSLKCKHIFHLNCITKWIKKTSKAPDCPTCRDKISEDMLNKLFFRSISVLDPVKTRTFEDDHDVEDGMDTLGDRLIHLLNQMPQDVQLQLLHTWMDDNNRWS